MRNQDVIESITQSTRVEGARPIANLEAWKRVAVNKRTVVVKQFFQVFRLGAYCCRSLIEIPKHNDILTLGNQAVYDFPYLSRLAFAHWATASCLGFEVVH